MSRIEIDLKEYNSLKQKIKDLEKAVNDVSKETSLYKDKLGKIESAVLDLKETTLISRLFKWNKSIKQLLALSKTR